MARPRNTEARRAQIIDALLRLLPRSGYDRASVHAIAREAGLTPGLVHYHFHNKAEVLLALVDRISDRLQERLERRLEAANDPWARLDAWIDAHLARGGNEDEAAVRGWAALGAEAMRDPEVAALFERTLRYDLARLTALVEDLLRIEAAVAGRPAEEEAAARIARSVLALVEGSYRLGTAVPELLGPGLAASTVRAAARALIDGALR